MEERKEGRKEYRRPSFLPSIMPFLPSFLPSIMSFLPSIMSFLPSIIRMKGGYPGEVTLFAEEAHVPKQVVPHRLYVPIRRKDKRVENRGGIYREHLYIKEVVSLSPSHGGSGRSVPFRSVPFFPFRLPVPPPPSFPPSVPFFSVPSRLPSPPYLPLSFR
jgi:hypothetical protein